MSTANLAPEAPALATELRRPLVWLLAILAIGLTVRLLNFKEPFQLDEFTALAAVAERQGVEVGMTATDENKLVPVASLAEVSNRSVIPYGVQDPVPLYHDVLWGVAHVLPVADWSMRLPSLLAGVGCVAAVFFLLRRPFGAEMALVAALFVALDPMQIAVSRLARPFALANLLAVLSFAALWSLLQARKPSSVTLLALGYAGCVAAIGYLNPLLLCVVAAHVPVVLYAVAGDDTGAVRKATIYWAAGLGLAVLLLIPEFGYFYRVSAFAIDHTQYLTRVNEIHIWTPIVTLFKHNLVFLGGLVLVLAAGAVVRMQLQGGAEEKPEGESAPAATDAPGGGTATAVTAAPPVAKAAAPAAAPAATAAPPEPAVPLPENEEALRMARFWIFMPQFALLVVSLFVAAVFFSRFLTYTTLGAAIVLAYYATRDGSREVRLGVAGAVALALLVVGFYPTWSTGTGLFSESRAQGLMGTPGGQYGIACKGMNNPDDGKPVWKDGDVILLRCGYVESDFLRSDIPEAVRPQVERVLVAPLTLLYPDASHKPVLPMPLSAYRNEKVKTAAGDLVEPIDKYFDADFVARLKPNYKRFWTTGLVYEKPLNSWQYLACVVPPLVTSLDRGPMLLSRDRPGAEHYITVPPHLAADDSISGLVPKADQNLPEDLKAEDFGKTLHIVKKE